MAYDLLTGNDGRNFLYVPITNYADYSLSASEMMLGERMAIMGLGGGAHVGFILTQVSPPGYSRTGVNTKGNTSA